MKPLLLRALGGEAVERRPVWIMRQAGRVLPEYRALKEKYSFEQLSRNPELAAKVTLLPFAHFDYDAAITFADIMSPLPALGIDLRFAPGPHIEPPLRTRAQIDALADPDDLAIDEIAAEVYATQKIVRAELGDRCALLGFAGAPLTLAAYLVEGKGARDFPRLRALAHGQPEAFDLLLDKLTRLVERYLIEQHRSGVDAVQIFDSWAGLLSEAEWRSRVRPHLLRMLNKLGEAGVTRILYLHGAPQLVDSFLELPSDALGVDWRTDLAEVRRKRPHLVLQGNLDPAVLLNDPAIVRTRTKNLLRQIPAQGHIVNLGHGIHPETSLEAIHAFVDTVKTEAGG